LETEIEERLNSEVESLKIQVKLLESELEISRMQAESSEEELRQLKATLRMSVKVTEMDASTHEAAEIPKPPPPPPPPMPNFLNSTNIGFRSRSNSQTLNSAISDAAQNLQQTGELKMTKKATGRNTKLLSLIARFAFSLFSLFHPRENNEQVTPFCYFPDASIENVNAIIFLNREHLATDDASTSLVVHSKQLKFSL
jgi:hypothetical protein